MIQRRTRDYEVSLWSLQDSFIAVLKQYGLEYKGQIEDGKINCRDDGTETFSFSIPMYYRKNGKLVQNPAWYSVKTGALLTNMRKIKVIFNKDSDKPTIYEFLIVKVKETHGDDNSFYCDVDCEGLAFHELGKIGYKISLSAQDFYNDDYDWSTTGKWTNGKGKEITTQPLATLNYWNDKIFSTIGNWTYDIQMNWDSYSLWREEREGVVDDYVIDNDIITEMKKRESNKVYEEDFIDAWALKGDEIVPTHITYAREKARVSVDIQDSNVYNITQSLAETFGVFCKYVYDHDATGHIIKRTVVYYNNFLNEQDGTMDISYPYQTNSINRSLDSTDLVTKLFVKSVDDSNTGPLSIIDVGANKSQEDYILNFDYLHSIGGITDEQYKAVDEYLLNMRKINEQLTPVSAKVISLQSQLTNLEAELTTVKNSITLATEQLLSSTALLDSITSGKQVLTISPENPQTAVLIEDKAEGAHANSYYIKLTQKGIYAQTIRIYRTYSYQESKLKNQLSTGIVEYDDYGEVVRISNLYLDTSNPSKTVYITYQYRPSLYYERVTAMWQDRLSTDQARQENLTREINRIKYSLYGTKGVDSIYDIDVSNLYDIDVYHKYQNLLKLKQDTIRDFNAMMGPALREGFWQPEDYTDYGDQYNERYLVNLANYSEGGVDGSTGNSKFIWDDQLFEGEQDVYYELTAAQYKQAYPCIDLRKHPEILKLVAQNPDTPISFVYKPTTSFEDNPDMRETHVTDNRGNDTVFVIPGLYQLVNGERKLSTKYENIKLGFSEEYRKLIDGDSQQYIQGKIENKYNSAFTYDITPSLSEKSSYIWNVTTPKTKDAAIEVSKADQQQNSNGYVMSNIEEEVTALGIIPANHIRISTIDQGIDSTGARLQLISNANCTMDGWKFTLVVSNNKGSNITGNKNVDTTTVKVIGTNSVTKDPDANKNGEQQLADDTNSVFNLKYNVSNTESQTMDTNYYRWQILNNNQWEDIISYPYSEKNKVIVVDEGNYHGQATITLNDDGEIHQLKLTNKNTEFQHIFPDANNSKRVRLVVQSLFDMLQDEESFTAGAQYELYGRRSVPYAIDLKQTDPTINYAIQWNDDGNNYFRFSIRTETFTAELNTELTAKWYLKDLDNNWQEITTGSDSYAEYSIQTAIDKDAPAQTLSTLIITLKKEQGLNNLRNRFLNKRVKYQLSNIKGKYQTGDQYFQPLNFTAQIQVEDNGAQQLEQLTPAIVANQGDSHNQFTQKTITISKIVNAERVIWHILPPNQNSIILDSNATTEDEQHYYKVVTSTDNNNKLSSTLTIRIPLMNNQNCLRDNGTKIYCVLSNGSENTMTLPAGADAEDHEAAATLVVSYPLTITPDPNGYEWWPAINDTEGKNIGIIEFDIPSNILGILNNTQQDQQVIKELIESKSIYCQLDIIKILNKDLEQIKIFSEYQNNIKAITDIKNITFEISKDISNIHFLGEIYFGIKELDILNNNGTPIIDTSTIDHDKDYIIMGKIQINYADIVNSINISILIRQNLPEFIVPSNQYIKSGDEEQPIFASNSVIKIMNNKTPVNINIQDYLKKSSYDTFNWKCGNEQDKWATYAGMDVKEIDEIPWTLGNSSPSLLECSAMITTHQGKYSSDSDSNTYSIVTIGINNQGDSTVRNNGLVVHYYGLGYHQHLYLQATSLWGSVWSNYFSFPNLVNTKT